MLPGARRCQMAQGGAREKPLLHLLPKRHRSCHPGVISRLKLATPCRPAWGSAARLQAEERPRDGLQVQILQELVPLRQHMDTLKKTFEKDFGLEVNSVVISDAIYL
uniref:Uncharacterized protein n=1 Tax=Rangifer tarandus platyrhynchus TaxID=3082113 RepID=A0ACB0EP41_RANTA|nr:unnamed protein product [Rangifer tarandus platyrhynchus]